MFTVPPSAYSWLIPVAVDISVIDQMAKEGSFPAIADLLPAVIYTFLFGIARLILQKILFKPVGTIAMKIELSGQLTVKSIDVLLSSKKDKKLSPAEVKQLAVENGLTTGEIKKYIWNKNRDEVSNRKLTKFCEAFWRALFYSTFCIIGYNVLCMPEPVIWLQETKHHWINWPYNPISSWMNFYYQIELGCYIHQLYWTEVTRTDALEMILHHVITIILILASYLTNFTRIGCSILFVHDFSDIFLEYGKCFNYTSKIAAYKHWASPTTAVCFFFFASSFFITRLVIYPRYLVYSLVMESLPLLGGLWPGYYLFASMLIGLQCLHVFWFYLIARMIWKLVGAGEVEKDVRSDDEDGDQYEVTDTNDADGNAAIADDEKDDDDSSRSNSAPASTPSSVNKSKSAAVRRRK